VNPFGFFQKAGQSLVGHQYILALMACTPLCYVSTAAREDQKIHTDNHYARKRQMKNETNELAISKQCQEDAV